MSANNKRQQGRLAIEDSIPEAQWNAPRRMYLKDGMTVQQVADALNVERRTASQMIKENLGLTDIGKRRLPGLIEPFVSQIDQLLRGDTFRGLQRTSQITKALLDELRPLGYAGCEKTIERYLRSRESGVT